MANRVQVKVNEDGLPVVATGGDRESIQSSGRAPSFTDKLIRARKELAELRDKERTTGRAEQAAAQTGAETWAGMERERGADTATTEDMVAVERELKDRLKPGQATTFYRNGKPYYIANTPRKGFQYGAGAAPLRYPNPNPDQMQASELDYESVDYWD